jgi:2'-5' RNA ligase
MTSRYLRKLNTIDRMPRYVAVLPLTPLRVGDGFTVSAWPLHVTIVPTFDSQLDAHDVGEHFAAAASGFRAIDVIVGAQAMFGTNTNVSVALIRTSPELTLLHSRLLSEMLSIGVSFDSPAYIGGGYRPHITATKRSKAAEDDQLHLTQIALVDMEPFGDAGHRRVVWALPLA